MRAYLFCAIVLLVAACNRKNTPSKPTHTTTESGSAAKPAEQSATVVVNGDGKVVNSTVKTSSGSKVYPVTEARSFTPNQKKNLMLRFKTVPPKVLHVPDNLAQKNAKGSYYVYKKKFWYWKSSDGYYYLDETYYE